MIDLNSTEVLAAITGIYTLANIVVRATKNKTDDKWLSKINKVAYLIFNARRK